MNDLVYHKTTLDNGLRIVTVPMPNSPSATAMVLVGVGSRHEPGYLAGISHFIEHNVFKGTKNRPRRNQVSEEIEGLGGITNAATGHDYTYYWAKAASTQINKILDVVMDISLNMTFPPEDLEIERGNVIEEMNMYEDNPMLRLQKDFFEYVWDGHPVGRRIIGTKETVSGLTREQMLAFVKEKYAPEQMIVVVAGNFKVEEVQSQIARYYSTVRETFLNSAEVEPFREFQVGPRVYLDTDQVHQTHLCFGLKTFGRADPRRYSLDLLNAVLGQGMSSRLFRKIRDEMGLAYYVGSNNYELAETGVWYARAGVDTKRAKQAIKAILGEFSKLAHEKVSEKEVRKAKEYIKGKVLLGAETSDDLGAWYGFAELLEKEVLSPVEYNARIEAVSAQDLQRLAQDLIKTEKWNLGVVGPFADKTQFSDLFG